MDDISNQPNSSAPTNQSNTSVPYSQPTLDPLPKDAGSQPTALNAPASAPVNPLGKVKILVVEDEKDAREVFVDLLESEDKYEVTSAIDGVDALAKAALDRFSLILLDIVMPNKDGIEVLQEIKTKPAIYGNPIVVMLTNISGDAAIQKAIQLGAVGFKLKSGTEPDQLLKEVESFLNGKVQNLQSDPVSKPLTENMQEVNKF